MFYIIIGLVIVSIVCYYVFWNIFVVKFSDLGILIGLITALKKSPKIVLKKLFGGQASTPSISSRAGSLSFPSSSEARFFVINDLVVLVRACDINKPVLLIVHGGPGVSEIPYHHVYGGLLEQHFVVIHYDQRFAGKSGQLNNNQQIKTKMSIQQHVDDLLGLSEWITDHYQGSRVHGGINLLGGSWGTVLALLAVQKSPHLFRFVVLRGVVTQAKQSEQLGLAYMLQQMRELKVAASDIAQVQNTGCEFGNNSKLLLKQREWLYALGGIAYTAKQQVISERRPIPRWRMKHDVAVQMFLSPEITLKDMLQTQPLMLRCLTELWPEIETLDMSEQVKEIEIPILCIHGRHDENTAHSLVVPFLERLKAPWKKLVWFDRSGHSPHKEEPEEFQRCLINTLLYLQIETKKV